MGMFNYKGIDINGSMISGYIEAINIDDARNNLISKGLSILSIKKTISLLSGFNIGSLSGRVKRRDIIEFARNTGMILKAGIPILDALEDVGQTTEKKALKSAMQDIKERVISGSTLSDALNANARIFPDILIRMVKIGEETGRVERSLMDIAEHLQRIEDLAETVKRALMYPIFVLVTTGGALLFWIIYVMPKLLSVIKEMGEKLPLITRIMLFMSNFVQSKWYILPLIPIAVIAGIKLVKRKENGRYYLDLLIMKLPIVKLFIYNKYLASFAEQMKIMVVAGITIDRSLIIVSNSVGSEVFRRAIVSIKEKISTGSRISDAIKEHSIFPKMVVRMIDVGESSGNLGDQFAFLSNFYFKKLDDVSEKLGKMIEPVMMTIVGIIFAFMIMAILLPIYDLVSKFK
ncbi:MAG: type II secretion system F family protein [Proteobacteria bacterium]|nr:type II secretion system F family protein [Pseudomonadota bacterium]